MNTFAYELVIHWSEYKNEQIPYSLYNKNTNDYIFNLCFFMIMMAYIMMKFARRFIFQINVLFLIIILCDIFDCQRIDSDYTNNRMITDKYFTNAVLSIVMNILFMISIGVYCYYEYRKEPQPVIFDISWIASDSLEPLVDPETP
jgi:hypothetical protein